MSSLSKFLSDKLERRKEEGLLRSLVTQHGLIDFSSNDYLGLAKSPELFSLISKKIEELPKKSNGATGSRLLSGNLELHEELEEKLATIFQTESALLFNSGYAANQAVLSSIPQKGDVILYDELVHACIKDGARLSLATRHSFHHNDLNDLERKIQRITSGRIFIAIESIYSMDGDASPLAELVSLTQKYNAILILDEAHSTGVMGKSGSGLATSLGLVEKIDIRIHTFGKAMGVHGACVAGSKKLTQYLINFARPFIYTTSLPPHSVISIFCAFDHLLQSEGLQNTLTSKVALFLKHADFKNRVESKSSIQTAIFPGNDNAKRAAKILQEKGFDVRPILSPTVPKDSERLRICLHTFNSNSEIEDLAKALKFC